MFSWFLTQQLCAEWLALNKGYFWIVWWRHLGLPGGELNHPSPSGGPDGVFSGDSVEQALLSQKLSVFAMSISLTFPVLGSRPREAQLRLWASPSDLTPQASPRDALRDRKPRCAWPPLPWPLVLPLESPAPRLIPMEQLCWPPATLGGSQAYSESSEMPWGERWERWGWGERRPTRHTSPSRGQARTHNYFLMCRSWNLDFLSL